MQPFQGPISGAGYGFVYIMSYPGSDKVKIGHSLDPGTRTTQIGGTLAPEDPVLEVTYWCSKRRGDVEKTAHKLVADTRHNGEWFTLTVPCAMLTIVRAADIVGVEIQETFNRAEHDAGVEDLHEVERRRLMAIPLPDLHAEFARAAKEFAVRKDIRTIGPEARSARFRRAYPVLHEILEIRRAEIEPQQPVRQRSNLCPNRYLWAITLGLFVLMLLSMLKECHQ